MRFCFQSVCALAMVWAATVWAGGSGLNVAVVINQNSTNSIQLANDYCAQRGVPPQNVLRVDYQWPGGSVASSVGDFQSNLCLPLLQMLQSRGLTNQIQFVLLSMDIPYTITDSNVVNSTTSVLFYGFKPDGAPVSGFASCSLPDDSSNSYAFSELPFGEAEPNTATTNSFLVVMLTDSNLVSAELILDRGVASDSSFPAQPVYLAKTDDTARNVRYTEFDNAIFQTRLRNDYSMSRIQTDSTSFTDILGLETGLADFTLASNTFVPGAIADTLTSFGGMIFQNSGQTPLLAFLDAGAVGSYGTVIEPCNYPQKFPNPLDYFYQARGFSLAEAYYQSVQNPFQGLMVGEPLSAPFALRGAGEWEGFFAGIPALAGRANLQVEFSAAASELPLNQVDLFVDGTWLQTITNIPPAAGDVLTVTVNGISNIYKVPGNATLASVANGLASVLNAASGSTQVSAIPFGDRIELHSLNPALPGKAVTLESNTTNSSGPPVTFLTPARASFLDSIATGYHYFFITNNPSVGDWLQLTVNKTSGATVTLSVTNTTSGETIGQFLLTLFNEIKSAPALQSPDGVYPDDYDDYAPYGLDAADMNLYAQSPGWPASAIQVTLTASPDLQILSPGPSLLQDNLSDLQARDHVYVASGKLSLPVNYLLDTTKLPDGYHQLTAVAYEGTSVRTQTQIAQNVRVQNTGLSASLNTVFGGSNTAIGATLQFSVVADTNKVSTIDLFSIGGLLASVTNEATANFSVATTNLSLGLLPFYAIVTDSAGDQYRTATTWINIIGPEPPISISVTEPPLKLSWTATAGRTYEILTATNVFGPYQLTATVIPSNSMGVWIDTNVAGPAEYLRLQTSY